MKTFQHLPYKLEVGSRFTKYREPLCTSNNGTVVVTGIKDGLVYYSYVGGRSQFDFSKPLSLFRYGVYLSNSGYEKEEL